MAITQGKESPCALDVYLGSTWLFFFFFLLLLDKNHIVIIVILCGFISRVMHATITHVNVLL